MARKEKSGAERMLLKNHMNIPKIQDDEHYLSFLLRVVEANEGFSSDVERFFENIGYNVAQGKFHPERLTDPINSFSLILTMEKTPLEFYMKSTEMQFANLVEKEEMLDYFWIKHYQSILKSNTIYRNNYVFNMCEICMYEERKSGQGPIIHLSHQLPYVKVCHLHNEKLHKYLVKECWHKPFRLERYDEIDTAQACDTDYRFAKFMYELSKQRIDYSLKDIILDINKKMNSKSASYYLREASDERLVCLYNKYASVGGFQLDDRVEDLYQLMYFIYGDPQNIDIIPEHKHYRAFLKEIKGKYVLLGGYRETIIELGCLECHETFITTPRLILFHHECPHCKAITKDYYHDLAKQFCENMYRGRYQLKDFNSEKRRVIVYDSRKKKIVDFDVLQFITNSINVKKNCNERTTTIAGLGPLFRFWNI